MLYCYHTKLHLQKAQYSSETHTKKKSASMPGHYVYPATSPTILLTNDQTTGAPAPLMQSTPAGEQTIQKVSFSEKRKKVSKS